VDHPPLTYEVATPNPEESLAEVSEVVSTWPKCVRIIVVPPLALLSFLWITLVSPTLCVRPPLAVLSDATGMSVGTDSTALCYLGTIYN